MKPFDVILVGGGLQSGLIAAAMAHHDPDRRVLILERHQRIAGNHTWSFHAGDVPADCEPWVAPLVSARWDGYEVRLRKFRRRLGLAYASIDSAHFADHIEALPGVTIHADTAVEKINAREVRAGERVYSAELVIDNRGPYRDTASSCQTAGFQKFFGFEIETDHDWPTTEPILMDDSVDQSDGFRFFYCLPHTPRRVLVEDTRFSDTPTIERDESLVATREYLRGLGVDGFRVVREEHGVLPMPFAAKEFPRRTQPLAGGYRGGWFHAATGYSFPLAVTFAHIVATHSARSVPDAIETLAASHRGRARFSRFLNRLLFRLVAPEKRYQIFRRFYRVLTEDRVARFYAHQFSLTDAARIVIGVPPAGLRPFRFVRSLFPPRSSARVDAMPPTVSSRPLRGPT